MRNHRCPIERPVPSFGGLKTMQSRPMTLLAVNYPSAAPEARLDFHVALLWAVGSGGLLWGLLIFAAGRLF